MELTKLEKKAKYLRKKAFEIVINAGKGHLGGSFSCTEILVALYYGNIMRYDAKNPNWEERDRFILSKGHANNTLYVLLADLGFYPESELGKYSEEGSFLGGHCDPLTPGVEIITGSLGHGLGVSAGIVFGERLNNKKSMTFVVLGDGECQEGSIWEAAMFAGHHKLKNLVTIVDRNRLGSEEFTEKSVSLEPFEDKWKSFGWEVRAVDGHSISELLESLKDCRYRRSDKPLLILANTVKGKGISSLENTPKAHHTLPKGDDVEITRRELV